MEKDNKKRNLIVIVLSVIIVLLVGVLVYLLFIRKDDKQGVIDNTSKDNVQENSNDKNTYTTEDGKFTLKIVDKNNIDAINKAKNEAKNAEYELNFERIIGYMYVNEDIVTLSDVKEDDNYVLYSGDFVKYPGMQYSRVFLLEKKTNKVIEQPKRVKSNNDMYVNNVLYRFGGEGNGLTFIKTPAGYFYAVYLYEPFDDEVTVYTKDWKELGYVSMSNIKSDEKGIYVYKTYDNNYKLNGSLIKYDVNGNKIS